jgi:hypothetical protein
MWYQTLLGVRNLGAPNTRFKNEHKKACKSEGTRFPRKSDFTSKVVNPFTRALEPPFYREVKGLLHSEIVLKYKEYSKCEHVQECLLPRDLWNYFHIFTSLPPVHTLNPDFWGNAFDLIFPWPSTLHSRKSPIAKISKLSSRVYNRSEVLQNLRSFHLHNSPNSPGFHRPEMSSRPAIQCLFGDYFAHH